ncbi:MAG: GGDEF domain-containing protein [Rhodobacteraceae bacterium]|nr:GGDEF domain-containing protein [Paracoccaceae bacterium]
MRGHILLIDPVMTRRIMTSAMLVGEHYTIQAVGSCNSATSALGSDHFDFVICTERPTGGTIEDVATTLTRSSINAKTPMLAISDPECPFPARSAATLCIAAIIPANHIADLLVPWLSNLTRAAADVSEWDAQSHVCQGFGLFDAPATFDARRPSLQRCNVAVVCSDATQGAELVQSLNKFPKTSAHVWDPSRSWKVADPKMMPDVFVLSACSGDDLPAVPKLLTALQSHLSTRKASVVALVKGSQDHSALSIWAADLLDKGIDDVLWGDLDNRALYQRLQHAASKHVQRDQMRKATHGRVAEAIRDPLTGLFNRRYISEFLQHSLSDAETNNEPLSVLLADIDHFKRVNDTYFHAAGDAVIRDVANRLRANLRDSDPLSRFGGEEFLAILRNASFDQAERAAQRIKHAIRSEKFALPDHAAEIQITVSIGVSVFVPEPRTAPAKAPSSDQLIAQADRSLYNAKALGRDRIELARFAA